MYNHSQIIHIFIALPILIGLATIIVSSVTNKIQEMSKPLDQTKVSEIKTALDEALDYAMNYCNQNKCEPFTEYQLPKTDKIVALQKERLLGIIMTNEWNEGEEPYKYNINTITYYSVYKTHHINQYYNDDYTSDSLDDFIDYLEELNESKKWFRKAKNIFENND